MSRNALTKSSARKLKISHAWLEKQLTRAFFETRKGKLRTRDEFMFEAFWKKRIAWLTNDIVNRHYKPRRGIAFIVTKPVRREIFAASFRDRLVHRLIYDMCYDWWDRRFIERSFSCRKYKGTLYGIKCFQKDMRQVTLGGKRKGHVLKFDLEGYFMSLSRQRLFDRAIAGAKVQFPHGGDKFQLLKYLWHEVIFDDPVDGVRIRPSVGEWGDLPSTKSLFCQPLGFGIVIGNLSSQLLSNIYLDQFDRFVTMTLGYKHYGRYVDDFYIVVTEEELPQALVDAGVIRDYLRSIGLKLHPKKFYIQPIEHGCEFLGMRVFINCLLPSKRFKGNAYAAMEGFLLGIKKAESIISYMGYSTHMNAHKFIKKILSKGGIEY
ncbi:RNA-directed DNA polymerase [Candidatus Saccharibacteria bacterium]|nr:RNA-directed DNA polymerase [Candidatus Saccharibacteria bacterium]